MKNKFLCLIIFSIFFISFSFTSAQKTEALQTQILGSGDHLFGFVNQSWTENTVPNLNRTGTAFTAAENTSINAIDAQSVSSIGSNSVDEGIFFNDTFNGILETSDTINWVNVLVRFNVTTDTPKFAIWNWTNSSYVYTQSGTASAAQANFTKNITGTNLIHLVGGSPKRVIFVAYGAGGSKGYVYADYQEVTLNYNDLTPPTYSNNITNTTFPAGYASPAGYNFNITCSDSNGCNTAFFESNFSSTGGATTAYNTTPGTEGSVRYNNTGTLATGTYYYKWYISDTSGNWNSTPKVTFNIIPDIVIKETGVSYTTIQSAINAATNGQTVIILTSKWFNENVVLNRSITLTSNSSTPPTINSSATSLLINANSATVTNLSITYNGTATSQHVVWITGNYTTVANNTITKRYMNGNYPVYVQNSANNTIYGNNITSKSYASSGIYIYGSVSTNNTIDGNTISYSPTSTYAIKIGANNNTIRNNNITSTGGYLPIYSGAYYDTLVMSNNYVNNKPIVYNKTLQNLTITATNYGELILANSFNVTINNSAFTDAGILFLRTTNSTITRSNITTMTFAVTLDDSSDYNTIFSNNISTSGDDRSYGITLYSGQYNNITKNNITINGGDFSYGIYIADYYNTIDATTITTSPTYGLGIYFTVSGNYNLISNTNITTSGTAARGILIEGGYNNITNCNITTTGSSSNNLDTGVDNDYIPAAIHLRGGWSNTISNCILNSTNYYDIFDSDNDPTDINYLVNITFNKTDIYFNSSTSSQLYNQYYLDAKVQDSFSNPLNSANVLIASKNYPNISQRVGFWRFDEGSGSTTADSSENGNTGTLLNGGTGSFQNVSWASGIFGGGLAFNGTNGYVNAGNASSLHSTNAITISAWIYQVGFPNVAASIRIVSKETGTNVDEYSLGTINNSATTYNVRFFVNTSSNSLTSATILNLNTWYFVVATWDGSTMRIYVNGVLDPTTTSYTGTILTTTYNVTIGNNPSLIRPFNGTIDEVQIWNRSLTNYEVTDLYDASGGFITNSSGYIPQQSLSQFLANWTYNSTNGYYYFNNYTVNASATGFTNSSQQINLTSNSLLTFTLTDSVPPTWSSNTTNIVSSYSPSTLSNFNITWNDNGAVSQVIFESNFAGTPTNYTTANGAFTFGNSIWSYNNTLPAGTYYWKSYANDSSNNWNASNTWYFTIAKANPVLVLSNNTASVNTTGLNGYWKFEEGSGSSVADSSGNGNYGTLGNATTSTVPTWTAGGMFGNGMKFNGNQFVNITNSTSLNISSAITLAAWIYPVNVTNTGNRIFVKTNSSNSFWLLRGPGAAGSGKVDLWLLNTSGGSKQLISSSTLSANNWYYVVATYDGSTEKLYINGNLDNSTTHIGNLMVGPGAFSYIGANPFGGPFFNGTIDEVQIWNRSLTSSEITEFYQSSATYPTQTNVSLSNCPTGQSDVLCDFFRNGTVSGIWHFDEGSGNITADLSGNGNYGTINGMKTVTSYNGARIDTSQSEFGGASGKFVASSSQYLNTSDSNDWNFGTGDFTIDFWVKFNTLPASGEFHYICGQRQNSSNLWYINLYNSTGIYYWTLRADYGGSTYVVFAQDSTTITTNTWYHIAVVRSGTLIRIYQDGSSLGGDTNTEAMPDLSGELDIGQMGNGVYFDGWLDEFRVSKGIARWTSDFTPPTSPYTADSPTVLLLHMDGTSGSTTFLDSSMWATGKYGSGLQFNGNNTFVNTTNNGNYSNLTVIAWVKINDTLNTYQTPIAKYNSGGQRAWIFQLSPDAGVGRIPDFLIFPNPAVSSWFNAYSGVDIYPNTWSQIAATYNGTVLSVYVNGVLANTKTNSSGIPSTSAFITIGDSSNNAQPFNGTIDEVRVYNRSLSASEILCQYGNNCTQAGFYNDTSTLSAGYYWYSAYASGGQNYTASSILIPLYITNYFPRGPLISILLGNFANRLMKIRVSLFQIFSFNNFVSRIRSVSRSVTQSIRINSIIYRARLLLRQVFQAIFTTIFGQATKIYGGTKPRYSANTTTLVSPYNGTVTTSLFNITWTNVTDLMVAGLIQLNYNNQNVNYTMQQISQSPTNTTYGFGINLPAGTLQYVFYANTTDGLWNSTPVVTTTISKGSSTLILSNNTASVNTTGLNGYWRFEEGSGTTAFDSSGNGNDGSLVGTATWTYRQPITISNSGSTLTNYQINVTLNTASLISAGKMNSTCQDIRFVDSDDLTQLNYWIETGCNTTATAIWVNVTTISNPSTTIYMYYGNPSATSNSNLTTVFENVFTQPSFESATGWTYTEADSAGNGCVPTLPSSAWKTEASNSYYQYCGFSNFYTGDYYGREYQTKSFPSGYNYIIRFDVNTSSVTSPYGSVEVLNGSTVIWSTTQQNTLLPNQETLPISSGSKSVYFGTHVTSAAALRYAIAYFDNIRVRKYVTQQPTTSFGNEQSMNEQSMINWTTGMFGNALNFNGASNYVKATPSSTVSGSFTVVGWANPSSFTSPMDIVGTRSPSETSFDMKFQNSTYFHGDIGNGTSWLTTSADVSYTFSTNKWYQVAYVVTSTGYSIFINGVNVSSGTYSSNTPLLFDSNHNVFIGQYGGNSEYFNGTIDEAQIWNRSLTASEIAELYQSSAIYPTQTNISLSNCPTSGASDVGCDFFRNGTVAGIWHFDEGTGNTTADLSGNGNYGTINPAPKTVTSYNGASIDTSQFEFGGASGKFVASSSQYLSLNDSADWYFNTGDFTIDFWVRFNGTQPDYAALIAGNNAANNGWTLDTNFGANTGKLRWITKGSGTYALDITSSTAIASATWTHVAIVRYGNTVTMYLNGTSVGSKDVTGWTINSAGTGIVVARQFTDSSGYYYNGWIDELRITKGVARWTSNFTTPTSPYTTDSSTVLLLHMDGTSGSTNFLDSSMWTTGKYGNGLNFDGSSSYVQTTSNELKTDNSFTILIWFKANSTAYAGHLIWEGNSTGNGWGSTITPQQEMHISMGDYVSGGINNKLSFFLGDIDIGSDSAVLQISTDFTDTNNWNMAVVTVNNLDSSPSSQLFLNGVLKGSDTGTLARTGRSQWDTNLRIGSPGSSTRYFNGTIDEVRIYPRALSDAEIICQYGNNCTQAGFYNDTNTLGAGYYYYPAYASGGQNYTSSSLLLPLTVNKGITTLVLSNGTASVNTSQLVGYWRFEEGSGSTASDSSGNGNTGTLYNNPAWASGYFGNALNFSGTSFVNASVPQVNTAAGGYTTVSFWMNWNGTYNVIPFNLGGGSAIYDLWIRNSTCMGLGSGAGDAYGINPSGLSNKWIYVTLVLYNGIFTNNDMIYINGVKQTLSQCSGSAGNQNVGNVAYIGVLTPANGYYFGGLLDEVQIWNRSLTDSEINELYQSSAIYPTQTNVSLSNCPTGQSDVLCDFFRNGTVSGIWHFDEGSGNITADLSGNGNYGTLQSNTTWTPNGRFGNAVYFNGSQNNYVNIPDNSPSTDFINTSSYTWTAWINMINIPSSNSETVIRKHSGGTSGYLVRISSSQKVDFHAQGFDSIFGSTTINLNTWYHVAAVYYGNGTGQIFVNGITDGTSTFTQINSDTTNAIRVSSDFDPGRFNGTIDEVRLYPTALSAAEILCQYGNNCTQAGFYNDTNTLGAGYYYYPAYANAGQNYTSSSLLLPLTVSKGNPILVLSNGTASVNTSQLVGYWRFEEGSGSNAFDLSGNGNTGTLESNNVTWTANGQFGSALVLNGSFNGAVNVSTSPSLNMTDSLTVTAWFNLASNGTGADIVTKGDAGASIHTRYSLRTSSSDPRRIGFIKENSTGDQNSVTGTTRLNANTWYFGAGVYNGTHLLVYLNGQLENTAQFIGPVGQENSPLRFGKGVLNAIFNGTIDEVQIWNRSLTASEIAELYQSIGSFILPVTITGSCPTELTCNLYQNTTSVSNPNTISVFGYYYYLYNTSGNANYTTGSILIPVNIIAAYNTIFPALSFAINNFINMLRSIPRTIAQLFTINNFAAEMENWFRTISQSFSIKNFINILRSIPRIISQSLSIINFSGELEKWFRTFSQSFALNNFVNSLRRVPKSISQSLLINNFVGELEKWLRTASQSFAINNFINILRSIPISLSQSFTINNFSSRILSAIRLLSQSIRLNNFISSLRSIPRSISQSLALNNFTGEMEKWLRLATQSLAINNFINILRSIPRSISQSLLINNFVGELEKWLRTASQSFAINNFINILRSIPISLSQSFTINNFSSRILSAIRLLSQSIRLNNFISSLRSIPRSISQSFTINSFTGRFYSALRSLSQSFSINNFVNSLRSIPRSISQSLAINNFSSRILTALRTASQSFKIINFVNNLRSVPVTISQSFRLNNFSSRILSATRSLIQSLSINNFINMLRSIPRPIIQSLAINNFTGELEKWLRTAVQSFALNNFVSSLRSIPRSLTQSLTLNSFSNRIFSALRLTSQSLSINNFITSLRSVPKSISQSFRLNNFSSRIFVALRTLSQSLSINSFITSLRSIPRLITQSISINNFTGRFYSSLRSLTQSLSLNNFINTLRSVPRSISQSLSINNFTGEMEKWLRTIAQSLAINNFVNNLRSIPRLLSQSLAINNFSNRILLVFRSLSQSLQLNNFINSLRSIPKSITQTITLNNFSTRILTSLRSISQSLSINSFANILRSIPRSISQSLSINTFSSRILSALRFLTQSLSINNFVNSLRSIPRSIPQTLSINNFSSRIFIALRTLSQSLSLNNFINTLRSVPKSISQSLSINNFTGRFYSALRSLTQSIRLNNFISSLRSIPRSISQSLSINNFANRIFSALRLTSQSFSINNFITSLRSVPRLLTQSLSINSFSSRIFSAMRSISQSFTITNFISSLRKVPVSLIQTISLNNFPSRILLATRSLTQSFKLNNFVSSLRSIPRSLSQSLSINNFANRIFSALRLLSQSFSINNFITSLRSVPRSLTQSLSINNFSNRILSAIRTLSQSLSINNFINSLRSVPRSISQSLAINNFSSRILTALRTASQSFKIINFVNNLRSVPVTISQSFRLNNFSSKILTAMRSISQSFTITNFISGLRKVPITLTQSLSINNFSSRIFVALRTLSQSFSINNFINSLRSVPRFLTQSLSINNFSNRILLATRSLTQSIRLNNFVSSIRSVPRTISQSFILNNFSSRILSAMRSVTQSVTINNFASSLQSFSRSALQSLTLNNFITKSSLFLRSAITSFGLNNFASTIYTQFSHLLSREAFIGINIIDSANRQLDAIRNFVQPFTLTNFINSLRSVPRFLTQSLSINNFANRIFSALRLLSQSFSINNFITSLRSVPKSLSQSLSINSFSSKILTAMRSISQSFRLTSTVNYLRNIPVTISQSFTINNFSSRILSVIRTLTQSLSINNFITSLRTVPISIYQSIGLNNFSSRILTSLRSLSQSLSINNFVSSLRSIPRVLSQSLAINNFSSRILSALRFLTQSLRINNFITSLRSVPISISQSLSINTFSNRILTSLRSLTQSLSINNFITSLRTVPISISQTLSINNFSTRLLSALRLASQSLSINSFANSLRSVSISLTQSISLNSFSNAMFSALRLASQSLSINNFVTTLRSIPISISQSFSLNNFSSKIFSAIVSIPQFLSINNFASQSAIFSRFLTQSLQIQAFSFNGARTLAFSIIQSFSFNNFSTRVLLATRSITQSLALNSFSSSIFSAIISVLQSLSFSTSNLTGFVFSRLISSSIAFNADFATTMAVFSRSLQQTLSFTGFSSRTSMFTGLITQSLSINSLVNGIRSVPVSLFQSLAINSFSNRILSAFRSITQSFTITSFIPTAAFRSFTITLTQSFALNNFVIRLHSVSLSVIQSFTINNFISKFRILSTFVAQTFSINNFISSLRSIPRSISQSFAINDFSSRLANYFRFTSEAVALNQQIYKAATFFRNIFASFSSMLTNFETYTCIVGFCPTPTTSTSTATVIGPGGGGGGGGIITQPPLNVNLAFEPGEISRRLNPGETDSLTLTIFNNQNNSVTVNLSPSSEIQDYVSLGNSSLIIKAKSSTSVTVNFRIPQAQSPGTVISGNIVANVNGVSYNVKTTLIIESAAKVLLDVETSIPDEYKIVSPGDKLFYSIRLFNLGQQGRVDVNLTYGIRNSTTEIISQKQELAIETQISLEKFVTIPADLQPGKYQLFATASYGNTTASASTDFTVAPTSVQRIRFAIIIALVLIILLAFGLYYNKRDVYTNLTKIRSTIVGKNREDSWQKLKLKWEWLHLERKWKWNHLERKWESQSLKSRRQEILKKIKRQLNE